MVRIGTMSHRLTLQQPSGDGSFTDVETVWGALTFMGHRAQPEELRNGAPMTIVAWQIVIWYRTDIRAEWRVRDADEGRVFQVSGYGDPDGKRSEMTLVCTEIQ